MEIFLFWYYFDRDDNGAKILFKDINFKMDKKGPEVQYSFLIFKHMITNRCHWIFIENSNAPIFIQT